MVGEGKQSRLPNRPELIERWGWDCHLDDTEFLTRRGWRTYDEAVEEVGTVDAHAASDLEQLLVGGQVLGARVVPEVRSSHLPSRWASRLIAAVEVASYRDSRPAPSSRPHRSDQRQVVRLSQALAGDGVTPLGAPDERRHRCPLQRHLRMP